LYEVKGLEEALGLKQKNDIEDKISEFEREIDRIVIRLYSLKEKQPARLYHSLLFDLQVITF